MVTSPIPVCLLFSPDETLESAKEEMYFMSCHTRERNSSKNLQNTTIAQDSPLEFIAVLTVRLQTGLLARLHKLLQQGFPQHFAAKPPKQHTPAALTTSNSKP